MPSPPVVVILTGMTIRLPCLPSDPSAPFPPAQQALREPNGLLAMGGDLSPVRLMNAYRNGIFPWFSEGDPPLWWCPDPRTVFDTERFRLSSRFCRALRHSHWRVRFDQDFNDVIAACASTPRPGQSGTWITSAMQSAYCELHRLGHAHCVAVHDQDRLVGGIYGVAIGRMFFGESMFSGESGGSKVALAALARQLAHWRWPLIDAQVENPHLQRMGARLMDRQAFLAEVARLTSELGRVGSWHGHTTAFNAAELATSTPPK